MSVLRVHVTHLQNHHHAKRPVSQIAAETSGICRLLMMSMPLPPKTLRMEGESCQATSRGQRRAARGHSPPAADCPGRPAAIWGRLPGLLLLPGERQPRPGHLHQSSGPHPEAPASRRPPPAHRRPGRELLLRWARGEDPCGAPERGPGLQQSEGVELHPDPAGGLHPASGHEGGGGRRDRSVFCQSEKGLKRCTRE